MAQQINKEQHWRKIFVKPKLPQNLEKLHELSLNLWSFWNYKARDLFREVDEECWEKYKTNPVAILEGVSYSRMQELASDDTFLQKLDEVYREFEEYMNARENPEGPKISYFCMEYGLDPLIKLYSGGLGVLAGDHLKEASDSKLDLTAVGLLYRLGYFKQSLTEQGDQVAVYKPQKFTYLPLEPVKDQQGEWMIIEVDIPHGRIFAKVWCLRVGSVPLYLLDTDIEQNMPEDRKITAELYGGDSEYRLKQELLLGIGGVRLLEKIGHQADVYHLNEGHAAFTGLERIRMMMKNEGMKFPEAVEAVKASSLFTTHTPVPAGHDAFNEEQMRRYFTTYTEELGIDWMDFSGLGRKNAHDPNEPYSMSFLAARLSHEINGVSRLHGDVSKDIFKPLYEGYFANEVPIGYVTNGAHYGTHTSREMMDSLKEVSGDPLFHQKTNPKDWAWLDKLSDQQLWNVRTYLKKNFINFLRDYLTRNLTQKHQSPRHTVSILSHLREDALIIGFARRFATYKRATLLFNDLEKLARIVNNPERPVIFIFSGKAHPRDEPGQELIKQVIKVSHMPEFLGKVIFLEDYNMYSAKFLVSGCDVWLNTPTRPLEASGTSGIKACFNGVLNLSVLDGWWDEGYIEGTGWALEKERTYDYQQFQNELDAEYIYHLLQDEVVPAFYNRNDQGLPVEWLKRVRKTLHEIVPRFTMTRMIEDYRDQYYLPLYERHKMISANHYEKAKTIAQWKENIRREWPRVEVESMDVFDSKNLSLDAGQSFEASIRLKTGDLNPEKIGVEAIVVQDHKSDSETELVHKQEFELAESRDGVSTYKCSVKLDKSGVYNYSFRLFPIDGNLATRYDLPLLKWI